MRALRAAHISAAAFARAHARFRHSATFAVLVSAIASTVGTTLASVAARPTRPAPIAVPAGAPSIVASLGRRASHNHRYIDDVYFPHTGWWNVALVIDAATDTDSVAFNVVLPASAVVARGRPTVALSAAAAR